MWNWMCVSVLFFCRVRFGFQPKMIRIHARSGSHYSHSFLLPTATEWWNRKRVASCSFLLTFCIHLLRSMCIFFRLFVLFFFSLLPLTRIHIPFSFYYYSQIEWALRRNCVVRLICFVWLFVRFIYYHHNFHKSNDDEDNGSNGMRTSKTTTTTANRNGDGKGISWIYC